MDGDTNENIYAQMSRKNNGSMFSFFVFDRECAQNSYATGECFLCVYRWLDSDGNTNPMEIRGSHIKMALLKKHKNYK